MEDNTTSIVDLQTDSTNTTTTNKNDEMNARRIMKKRVILVITNVVGVIMYLLDVMADLLNASNYLTYQEHFMKGQ